MIPFVFHGFCLSIYFFLVYFLTGMFVLARLLKVLIYLIWMWFRCCMDEILERQLLLRGRAFATFSTIEKPFAGLKKTFRGPFIVQGCFSMSAKDRSEWRWAFSFYGVENWLLLRMHGRRKGGLDFEIFSKKGCFLSFEWKQSNFTTFCPPWKNLGKIS